MQGWNPVTEREVDARRECPDGYADPGHHRPEAGSPGRERESERSSGGEKGKQLDLLTRTGQRRAGREDRGRPEEARDQRNREEGDPDQGKCEPDPSFGDHIAG